MEHFCRMCPPYERHKKYCLLLTCVSKEWFEKKMVHFSMILIVPIYSRLVMSCLKHTVTINQINASVNHLSWFFIRKTYLFSQKMPFLFILWGYPHKKKHFFLKNFRCVLAGYQAMINVTASPAITLCWLKPISIPRRSLTSLSIIFRNSDAPAPRLYFLHVWSIAAFRCPKTARYSRQTA